MWSSEHNSDLWFRAHRTDLNQKKKDNWLGSNWIRLRLHGTRPEPFRTEPGRIGLCLNGTILEPVRSGYKRIQNWTYRKVNPVLDPLRTGSEPVRCRQKAYQVRFSPAHPARAPYFSSLSSQCPLPVSRACHSTLWTATNSLIHIMFSLCSFGFHVLPTGSDAGSCWLVSRLFLLQSSTFIITTKSCRILCVAV